METSAPLLPSSRTDTPLLVERIKTLRNRHKAIAEPGQTMLAVSEQRHRPTDWIEIVRYDVETRTSDGKNETATDCLIVEFFYLTLDVPTMELIRATRPGVNTTHPKRMTYREFTGLGDWVIYAANPAQTWETASGILEGNSGQFAHELARLTDGERQERSDQTTALMGRGTKAALAVLVDQAETRRLEVLVMKTFMNFVIKSKMDALMGLSAQANAVATVLKQKVVRLMRMITLIELYAGISEELHQLQAGPSASPEERISFRQLVLFMDEEIAVSMGFEAARNFDVNCIEQFDEWLLEAGNLNLLLPEPRGIVVLRPRRAAKEYDYGNPFVNARLNVPNQNNTYFLIRDGANVYRIFTDRLTIPDRLFPRRQELEAMFVKLDELTNAKSNTPNTMAEAEDQMYRYRKQAMFLQGLLDRTTVFGPLEEPINLFALTEQTAERIQFIYDDDAHLLSDSRPPFQQWLSTLNSQLAVGDRIIISSWLGGNYRNHKKDYRNRLWYEVGEFNAPDLPGGGIYTLEAPPSPKHLWGYSERLPVDLCIKYNPGGTIWGSWGDYGYHERKNRISWAILRSDRFLIDFDRVLAEDLRYYLFNRVQRQGYVEMLPLLETLLRIKEEERRLEAPFVRMVCDEVTRRGIKAVSDAAVWDAIRWWKTKNKWKRAISADDAKALRMIVNRLIP